VTAGAAAAVPSAATAPTSSAPEATKSRDAQFGQELLPPTSRPAQHEQESVLHSSIASMREVAPRLYLISLSNGQVWRQEEADQTAAFMRVGEDVAIQKGTLGSYRLWTASIGGKNWLRVTRVQ